MLTSSLNAQELDTAHWNRLNLLNNQAHALTSSNIDSAEILNSSLFDLVKEPIDALVLSNINSVRANIYYNRGDFENSLKYNLECLNLRQRLKDTMRIGQTYTKLANIYYATDDYEKCREYLNKSNYWLKLAEVTKWGLANNCNTMALSFLAELNLDSSSKYFNTGLQYLKGAPDYYLDTKADFLANLATIYDLQGNPEAAFTSLDSAMVVNLSLNDFSGLSWDYYKKAEICLSNGFYDLSFKNLRNADSLSQYSATLDIIKNIQYGFFKYYLLIGENDSALKYNEIYYVLNDSVVKMQTDKNIQDAEAKYQVEKTNAAYELEVEKSERFKAENKNKDLIIWIIIGFLIALLIVFALVYKTFKNRRQMTQLELTIKENQLDEVMANQESKAYSAMLKGQEEERERIAQDLHDRLGGTLAALKLSLRRPGNSVETEDLAIVDEAVNEVRSIAHNLSSGILKKYGLNEALQQLKQTIERTGGIKIKIYLDSSISTLGQFVTLELYRTVQELVSNTLKHAEASEISIQTNMDSNSFNLIYEDNGKGFNLKDIKGGIGLENIKARVKKMRGTLHIDAEKGRGAIFIIELNK